jgi:hypothetical protein
MSSTWDHIKARLQNSPNDVQIVERSQPNGKPADYGTTMETIAHNVSHIVVNKCLRILGSGDSVYENMLAFTVEFRELFGEEKYLVAHDAFGGLFASEQTIQYFSPDNLQWEDLGVNYDGFISWIAEKDISDFYESFMGPELEDLVAQAKIDEGIFLYPFLWAQEYDAETAHKKIVPFKELMVLNAENRSLFAPE